MRFYENIIDTIGSTPLVRLHRVLHPGTQPLVLAKAESFNPGGSAKDRIAKAMLLAAEKEGQIKAGGTVVEPTSGNTGVGLAIFAASRGYKTVFTMPEKMSKDKEFLLKAYGATVIRTPTNVPPEDERSYYKVAEKVARETPGAFVPNQFANPNNPAAHFASTGPEIWKDTDGEITHFVAGIGTGGRSPAPHGTSRQRTRTSKLSESTPRVRSTTTCSMGQLPRATRTRSRAPGRTSSRRPSISRSWMILLSSMMRMRSGRHAGWHGKRASLSAGRQGLRSLPPHR